MESPGTGAQRGQREKAWVKIQKEQKVKRSKVTFDKSESEKVNVVNGELGESVESANVNAK